MKMNETFVDDLITRSTSKTNSFSSDDIEQAHHTNDDINHDKILGGSFVLSKTRQRRLSTRKGKPQRQNSSLLGNMSHRQEVQQETSSRFKCSKLNKFYIKFVGVPILVSLMYAIAILFPAGARSKAPLLLWTDGALIKGENGKAASICPLESICAEGILQIFLIGISRLTAFASYVLMGQTYLSRMHSTIHALSTSFVGTMIPLGKLHKVHKSAGKWYSGLAVLHTITHLIRWILRGEMGLLGTSVGVSGMLGVVSIVMTVVSMSPIAKRIERMTFEMRFTAHWTFFLCLIAALCLHSPRCRVMTLIFSGLWFADYTYGFFFKTYRLDLVEFTALPNRAGVQMLWRNPPGFQGNSGEYVKVQLPWLLRGGDEWHPFSIYMREETEKGLDEVLRKKYNVNNNRAHLGGIKKIVDPSKTALLLVEYQNELATEGGKLHGSVRQVMESTNMLQKTVDLVDVARSAGAYIFHLPIVLEKDGSDNPNKYVGVLKACRNGAFFVKGSWNAEIVDCLNPRIDDVIIRDIKGLDGFIGTDLQEQLEMRGVETIILGGFLTNGCVESTMRTGYEKGYNVITLEDGTACTSHAEQDASMMSNFKMFSTTMDCSEAAQVLMGTPPSRLIDESQHSNSSFETDYESEGPVIRKDLPSFIYHCMLDEDVVSNHNRGSLIMAEAREEIRSQYNTTQIFMTPTGDWTEEVYDEVIDYRQLRHCWVKGPYVSPYSSVSNFSNLVLVASGIGITPALGVMGQYQGNSRTKILIWSTRCPMMLKFFVPLFEKDATIAIIYYTGKEILSDAELKGLSSSKNIFIQRSRPTSLTATVTTVITSIESLTNGTDKVASSVSDIPAKIRKQWCLLYCGGSKKIKDMFREYAEEVNIKFEFELFDW